jgi:hypothetical protein
MEKKEMNMTKTTSNGQKLNILKSEVFHGITVDMQDKFLNQIPWIVSVRITVGEAVRRLDEVSINTLFVVDDDDKLVGIMSKDPGFINGFKGGPKKCQNLCDSKCADRGGCAFICWNPWGGNAKCLYECEDQFDQAQTVGATWF